MTHFQSRTTAKLSNSAVNPSGPLPPRSFACFETAFGLLSKTMGCAVPTLVILRRPKAVSKNAQNNHLKYVYLSKCARIFMGPNKKRRWGMPRAASNRLTMF